MPCTLALLGCACAPRCGCCVRMNEIRVVERTVVVQPGMVAAPPAAEVYVRLNT